MEREVVAGVGREFFLAPAGPRPFAPKSGANGAPCSETERREVNAGGRKSGNQDIGKTRNLTTDEHG
jgi:hypothetical protein